MALCKTSLKKITLKLVFRLEGVRCVLSLPCTGNLPLYISPQYSSYLSTERRRHKAFHRLHPRGCRRCRFIAAGSAAGSGCCCRRLLRAPCRRKGVVLCHGGLVRRAHWESSLAEKVHSKARGQRGYANHRSASNNFARGTSIDSLSILLHALLVHRVQGELEVVIDNGGNGRQTMSRKGIGSEGPRVGRQEQRGR